MGNFRNDLSIVTIAGTAAGILAVGAVAVGITNETPEAVVPEPVAYSEPSWTDTSTLIIGGYEVPSPEMIATAPPLSER